MSNDATPIERDFDDLLKRQQEWRDWERERVQKEKQIRESAVSLLRDVVTKAAHVRRVNGIPLQKLVGGNGGLSLEDLVAIEDFDSPHEQKVLTYVRLVVEQLRPKAEYARRVRAERAQAS